MKRFAAQSKLMGTAVLALVAWPLLAQSPDASSPTPVKTELRPPIKRASDLTLVPIPATATVDLPVLTLPAVAAPQPVAAPAVPAAESALPVLISSAPASSDRFKARAEADVLPLPKAYSFGDSQLSILFLPDQISRMKVAIRSFEDTGKDAAKPTPVIEVVAAPVAPEVIEDPLVYPVFYLSTIAYDTPGEWSLWVSGYKITSRHNYTDVTVLNVARDSVTFLWKPSFMKAIMKRDNEKRFAAIDPVKHKLVTTQAVSIDETAESVVFTLKPNQSFAPGYFKTFEGYIDSPTLTALPVVVAGTANAGQPALGQPNVGQPVNQSFDANGNPINGRQNFNSVPNFESSLRNFNPSHAPVIGAKRVPIPTQGDNHE